MEFRGELFRTPTMMVTCMNDPGTGTTQDPLYNPIYSNFCYEIPFMPAQTQYMDTPVVPTSAYVGAGYNNPDCAYPDATPAVSEVDVDSNIGPWAPNPGTTHMLHIFALGTVPVNNYGYSGPSATAAPFNAKMVSRRYSFGGGGTVALVSPSGSTSVNLAATWGDTAITATVPANLGSAFNCPVQQQVQYGGPVTTGIGANPAKCGQLVITSDRKSTRLNSSHSQISYAVFCLKKKKPSLLSLLLQSGTVTDASP